MERLSTSSEDWPSRWLFWGLSKYHFYLLCGFRDWGSKVRNPVIVQPHIAVQSLSFSETEILHLWNVTNSWSSHLSGLLGWSWAAEYSLHHSVPQSPSPRGPGTVNIRSLQWQLWIIKAPKPVFAMLREAFAPYGEEQNCLQDRASLCSGRDHFVKLAKLWRCFCRGRK